MTISATPAPSDWTPNAELSRLFDAVSNHPNLDFRLWAGMTILINLDVCDAVEEGQAVAVDVISSGLVSGRYQDHLHGEFQIVTDGDGLVIDVGFDDVYGDDQRADALLAIMKSPNLSARVAALNELSAATLAGELDLETNELAGLEGSHTISH